jgi:transcriptional regulator with XRE-family HTH domain
MDVRQRLAVNVKRLRKERGWSQEMLADEAGLDRTYISGIERIVRNPTITVVERISLALGCQIGELLNRLGAGDDAWDFVKRLMPERLLARAAVPSMRRPLRRHP